MAAPAPVLACTPRRLPLLTLYNPASRHLPRYVLLERAFQYVADAEAAGVTLQAPVWNSLMVCAGRSGELNRAFEVLTMMQQRGIGASATTYGSLIESCVCARQPEKALRVFEVALHKVGPGCGRGCKRGCGLGDRCLRLGYPEVKAWRMRALWVVEATCAGAALAGYPCLHDALTRCPPPPRCCAPAADPTGLRVGGEAVHAGAVGVHAALPGGLGPRAGHLQRAAALHQRAARQEVLCLLHGGGGPLRADGGGV